MVYGLLQIFPRNPSGKSFFPRTFHTERKMVPPPCRWALHFEAARHIVVCPKNGDSRPRMIVFMGKSMTHHQILGYTIDKPHLFQQQNHPTRKLPVGVMRRGNWKSTIDGRFNGIISETWWSFQLPTFDDRWLIRQDWEFMKFSKRLRCDWDCQSKSIKARKAPRKVQLSSPRNATQRNLGEVLWPDRIHCALLKHAPLS